jgi:hypothetical protein
MEPTEIKACVAAQASHEDGEHHVVGIWNLDVVVIPSGRFWYAQGLQIDYGVQGDSMTDAKTQFEKGLRSAIHHNIRIFGTIDKLLQVAPSKVWSKMWNMSKAEHNTYSQVSFHEILKDIQIPESDVFPFRNVNYTEVQAT